MSLLNKQLRQRFKSVFGSIPDSFLFIDTADQQLVHYHRHSAVRAYPVSTSSRGIGNKDGSFMTPAGIHKISEKIGGTAPPRRIFVDRLDTGQDCAPGNRNENMILSRILRLEGLEDGLNRGPGIDTFERYIYIHGTNREDLVGQPFSHGCICMKNSDIIDLFDSVEAGTIVVIN